MGSVEPVVVSLERNGLLLRAAAVSDTGKVRRLNEDSFLLVPGGCAVADGMGGHNAGDVASRLTIEAVGQWLESGRPDITDVSAVVARNERVRAMPAGRSRDGLHTAGFVVGNAAGLDRGGHVGDSRCRVDDGSLQPAHHRPLACPGAGGCRMITAQMRHPPERNVVTRAIGIEDLVAGDPSMPHSPACLLLPDGCRTRWVRRDRAGAEREADPAAATASLIASVLRGRAADNATAVVVDVVREPAAEAPANDELDITGPRARVVAREPDPDDTVVHGSAAADEVLIATVPAMQPKSFPPPTLTAPLIEEVPGEFDVELYRLHGLVTESTMAVLQDECRTGRAPVESMAGRGRRVARGTVCHRFEASARSPWRSTRLTQSASSYAATPAPWWALQPPHVRSPPEG
jgi:protein phosphatase